MRKINIHLLSLILCFVSLISLLPITTAAAKKETLGAPQDLKINKVYDEKLDKLVTKYGGISWKHGTPTDTKSGPTCFEYTLYCNDKVIYQWRWGNQQSEDRIRNNKYLSWDLSTVCEASGTYYFTVQAFDPEGHYYDSEIVRSEDWTYTKPSTKLAKPSSPKWNFPNMTWSDNGDPNARYHIELYYSPTKPDSLSDMWWTHKQWDFQGTTNQPPSYRGPGYYRFRVRTYSSNIKNVYHSNWVTSDIYHIKLDAPVVKHSAVESSGKPKITWNEIEEAEKYEVYRATTKGGDFKKINTTTSRSYTDNNASAGKNYYYKVRAVTANGAKSSYSSIVSRTCDLPRPNVKVSNVSSTGKIKLSWSKIEGAQKYQIYRSTSKNGEYTLMKTTTGTSYTNTSAKAGKLYYYKVKAIHSNSAANSAYSEVDSRRCDLARPSVTIKLKNGDPRLTWEKVSGAAKYQIYRATSKNGDYTLMKTTTGTSYTNTSAKAGKTYYYKVKAIHSNSSANSAYSSIKSIKAK